MKIRAASGGDRGWDKEEGGGKCGQAVTVRSCVFLPPKIVDPCLNVTGFSGAGLVEEERTFFV